MELKLRFLLLALVFSLLTSFIRNVCVIFDVDPSPYGTYPWVSFSINLVGFLVSPCLLFVILYFAGKGVNLETKFMSVATSLFIGNLIGQLFWFITMYFVIYPLKNMIVIEPVGLRYLLQIVKLSFSSELFISFAAVAFAYFVERRSERIFGGEPETF